MLLPRFSKDCPTRSELCPESPVGWTTPTKLFAEIRVTHSTWGADGADGGLCWFQMKVQNAKPLNPEEAEHPCWNSELLRREQIMINPASVNLFNMETVTSWVRSNFNSVSLGPCTERYSLVMWSASSKELIWSACILYTYYKIQLFNMCEKETIPTRLTNIRTIIILPILIIFECELEEFAGCV